MPLLFIIKYTYYLSIKSRFFYEKLHYMNFNVVPSFIEYSMNILTCFWTSSQICQGAFIAFPLQTSTIVFASLNLLYCILKSRTGKSERKVQFSKVRQKVILTNESKRVRYRWKFLNSSVYSSVLKIPKAYMYQLRLCR